MAEIVPISGYNDRVALHRVLPLSTPFTVNVFPVNACNFRCVYCAQSLGKRAMREQYNFDVSRRMTLETFSRLVEQSKAFERPYKLLSFMGHGEPLLHVELPEMVAMAAKAGIAERIEIITNGSLLTPELSDRLIAAGVTNLRVSLQGLSAAAYKKTSRVLLDFEGFLSNLNYFHTAGRSHGAHLFVKILDSTLNAGEEEAFYAMFDSLCSRMYIEKVKPVYAGVDATSHVHDMATDRYGNPHPPRQVCPLAFFSLAVWPDGEITPCDAIYRPVSLGNVNERSVVELFCGETANAFRTQLLLGKKNVLPGCKLCCAPDDVSQAEDELDQHAPALLEFYAAAVRIPEFPEKTDELHDAYERI